MKRQKKEQQLQQEQKQQLISSPEKSYNLGVPFDREMPQSTSKQHL